MVRVAINGFGRIGRLALRAAWEAGRNDIEFAAVNDLGSAEANAHLLKHDSTHGRFQADVKAVNGSITVDDKAIKVFAEREPEKLPWRDLGIDVVLECTGKFTKRAEAERHVQAGAKRVLISAPATDEDLTVVWGVNEDQLRKTHSIVSCASCTTNCLAPVASVLHKAIGIRHGYMTTIHAYTGDQRLLDSLHKDLRRARSAGRSMIPTTTGAARAVGRVLPELAGKLDGTAIRVPTENVSTVDFKFVADKDTSIQDINDAITKASKTNRLKGVLVTNDEPLVSTDFNHTDASSIFDLTQTQVIDGRLCRVLSWYDNEWGFANRMLDVAEAMANFG